MLGQRDHLGRFGGTQTHLTADQLTVDHLHLLRDRVLRIVPECHLRQLRRRILRIYDLLPAMRPELFYLHQHLKELHDLQFSRRSFQSESNLWHLRRRLLCNDCNSSSAVCKVRISVQNVHKLSNVLHLMQRHEDSNWNHMFAVRQFVFDLQHRKLADGLPLLRHYARTLLLRRQLHLYSLLW